MFNLFKRKRPDLDFSSKNLARLEDSIKKLKTILSEAGYGYYHNRLNNIFAVAIEKDQENFKNRILVNDLFGGSGAMWEIGIEDEELQNQFDSYFIEFIDTIKSIGVKNGRINQVRNYLNK